MKIFNKIFILALAFWMMGCDATDLDLLDNPNAVTPENASLNDLYNNIQLEFRNVYSSAQGEPGQMARMYHAAGDTYIGSSTDVVFNGLWNNAYADLFPDVEALLVIAEANNFDIHAGTAKIMQAYTILVLTDLLGEVPYSEALQGTDIISPAADSGEELYATAERLLDEAIALLDGTNAARPAVDQFYNGDPAKWIKAANSLKLRMALNMKDAATINSIVSGGNFITDAADDFAYPYGTTRTNPVSRHPFYQSHYEIGDGAYQSNYMMWLMVQDKEDADGITIVDPRSRYYFYRKVEDAQAQDQTTYSCFYSAFPDQSFSPAHWASIDPDLPYCVVPGTGYSGRDHLNGEGIPPDGPIRTSYGLYPGGGQFDDNTFSDTRQQGTTGGLGAGVWPIMMSSFMDLMRAEAALTLNTNDDARTMLESGIRKSMAKVQSFESLVPGTMGREVTDRNGTSTVKALYGLNADRIDAYVDAVLALYDAADNDGKLDLVAKEMMIAAFGNGIEGFNLYRRTGKPGNMQPALDPSPGDFPRTFLYPDVHITRNGNVSQKSFTDRVFYDDGSTNLY